MFTRRRIRDSVVLITGASSGIGRATAIEFARRGASLVLAARDEESLLSAAIQCENFDADVLAVTIDVCDEIGMMNLARHAFAEFGRIDTWVNNAGVTVLGAFEDTPPATFRQVVETSFFGVVNGARAALPYFREQGHGVLINVGSNLTKAAVPYATSYVGSKFAVRGFSESLRAELRGTGIDVCLVNPAATDTPLFQHAADYYGQAVKPPPPVYPPEDVAAAIVSLARRPRAEVNVGFLGQTMMRLPQILPARAYDRYMTRQIEKNHFQDRPEPPTDGNVFQPMPEFDAVSGGWAEPPSMIRSATPWVLAAIPVAALGAWAMARHGDSVRRAISRTVERLSTSRKASPPAPGEALGRAPEPQGIAAAVTVATLSH